MQQIEKVIKVLEIDPLSPERNRSLCSICYSSGEVNKATEILQTFFRINRELQGRRCFGALGGSTSSEFPTSLKSIELLKTVVFRGVLYAKCHFLATNVCKFKETQITINNQPQEDITTNGVSVGMFSFLDSVLVTFETERMSV